MRSFFVFGLDPSRNDLQSLVDCDLAGFDRNPLRRGERVDCFPADMRLFVSNKKRTDLLGNAFGWKIMSERALAIINEFVPEGDLQTLNPPIFDLNSKKPVAGYFLVNCLRNIPALTSKPGEGVLYADKVVIRDGYVPPNTHLFRLQEWPQHWIISGQLWSRLSGLDGFDANMVQSVPQ
jgi:hypothetical protein